MKILIADDEALSRRLLEKTLGRTGYEVTAVENGRLAVEQLNRPDGPRLALLDWVMPELDGPGVCREVRKLQEQREQAYVYIVLLTSKESKEDIVTGLESGADDYLTKPFNAEELRARLRTGERILHLETRLLLFGTGASLWICWAANCRDRSVKQIAQSYCWEMWITSNRSTIRTVTRSATKCCRKLRGVSCYPYARMTSLAATAAKNSCWS